MADSSDPAVRQAELVAALLAEQATLNLRLLRAYAKIYRDLTAEWLKIIDEIEQAKANGQNLGILTYRSARVVALALATQRQIERFAKQAAAEVEAQQKIAAEAAQQHAEEVTLGAIRALAPRAQVTFAALPTRAIENMVGRFANGMPVTTLFDAMGAEAAQQAQDVLVKGLAVGLHPNQAARKMRDLLGVPLSRAQTIARTEMLGVYRDATLQSYRANDDLVQAWRWNAHLDARTCLSCVALHGTIHPLDEAMREHVSGRCVPSPVLVPLAELGDVQARVRRQAGLDRTGQDYWDGLSDAEKAKRLGPAKWQLYQDGEIDLQDLVYADSNPIWGVQYREASISQARYNHAVGAERFSYEP